MELRHLRYFVAVAEEQHMTRAAERLRIQQPPLSQQIRALEDELGVQLLRRKPRGVELTEAGRIFFDDARAILALAEQAVASARRTSRGEQGTIVVGFRLTASLHPFVPAAVRAFQESYPDVSVRMDEQGNRNLAKAVEAERVDVAFVRVDASDTPAVMARIILEEKLIAAVPSGHAIAQSRGKSEDAVPLSAFAEERFLLYRRRARSVQYDALFNSVIKACLNEGFSPQVTEGAPLAVSTLSLVAAGIGITIVPESLRNMQLPGVSFLDLEPSPLLVIPLYLAFRTSGQSATTKNFVKLVSERARLSA